MLKIIFSITLLSLLFYCELLSQQYTSSNIALLENGISVSSNGDYDYKTVVKNAVDGLSNTYWAGLQRKGQQILTLDFRKTYTINKIKIVENNQHSFIRKARLQYYNGYDWQDIFYIQKNILGYTKEFQPITINKLRLVIESSQAPGSWANKVACIHAFEVYGYASKQNVNVLPNKPQPVVFINQIPNRIKLKDKIDLSFTVNKNIVSEYRYKLDVPGDWLGGIGYALNKWSNWDNNRKENIFYCSFIKEGTYKFTVEYKDKHTGKRNKISRRFKVYWEYPEIYFGDLTINVFYINSAPNKKEKYRRAAEEYEKAYNTWMKRFEYEYKKLKLTGNTAEEIVQLASNLIVEEAAMEILKKSDKFVFVKLNKFLLPITIYNLIKEGYRTYATVFYNFQANSAALNAIIASALYKVYWKKYVSYEDLSVPKNYFIELFSSPKFGENVFNDFHVDFRIKTHSFKLIRCKLYQDINTNKYVSYKKLSNGPDRIVGPYKSRYDAQKAQDKILNLANYYDWPFLLTSVINLVEKKDKGNESKEETLINLAKEIIRIIHNKNFSELSKYVNESYGVRFSPYYYIESTNKTFYPQELSNLNRYKKYDWGPYQDRDGQIYLSFNEYINRFVYDNNYLFSKDISCNKIIHSYINQRLIIKQIKKLSLNFVEFYKSSAGGVGSSIRLYFKEYSGKYYLYALVSDPWGT